MSALHFLDKPRRLIRGLAHAAIILAFSGLQAAGQVTPAGTIIRNAAEAIYFDEATGLLETVRSNEVAAFVVAVPAIDVTGGEELTLSRGARDTQYFRVSNTGNTKLEIEPEITLGGDADTLTSGQLHIDANRNGIVDEGDPAVSGPIALEQGADVEFIYSFEVAPVAEQGDLATVTLTAIAAGGASGNTSATGEVAIVSRTLELGKRVAVAESDAGTVLTYTLDLLNDSEAIVQGYDTIDGAAIRIDGTVVSGVLVRDAIPAGTNFRQIEAAGGMTALYHLAGAPVHDYEASEPSDATAVDAVAFFVSGDFAIGRSAELGFSVIAEPVEITTRIRNTAETYVPAGSLVETVLSNPVQTVLDPTLSAILEFRDPSMTSVSTVGVIGSDIALRLNSQACNASDAVDRIEVVVTSRATGDAERVIAVETEAGSGIFVTGPLSLVEMSYPVTSDGVLASKPGDTLDATTSCSGIDTHTVLLVAPGLFVFDSVTNAPIANTTVTLLDGVGTAVASVSSDTDGYFAFPLMPAGDYRFEVGPPADYEFPSVRPVFPAFGRDIDTQGSYGAVFSHPGGVIDGMDVPLDPSPGVPVQLEKTADRATAGPGGIVNYTLVGVNRLDQALVDTVIVDVLPAGTQLVSGSVTLDGVPMSDPAEVAPGTIAFDLATLRPRQTVEIGYQLQMPVSGDDRGLVNIAEMSGLQAGTGLLKTSAQARATVRLQNGGSVLTREATILGSVFMDCNGDGLRDGAEEPGVPGVRIVTQQGLTVVTDIDGRFSLVGLRPKAHVLLVQEKTLPLNTSVTVTRTTDLRRGGTRLVALKRGELVTENFALESCAPDVLAEVEERRKSFEARELSASDLRSDLPIGSVPVDPRSVRSEAGIATTTEIRRKETTQQREQTTSNAKPQVKPLAGLVRTLSSEPGFLSLNDGDVLRRRTLSVRVKARADLALSLTVNGVRLAQDRVGERTTWATGNVQALEYVAVRLRPGKNTLVLSGLDPFGNERVREVVTVIAPGEPVSLKLTHPEEAPASPGARIPVIISIRDGAGRAVDASGVVTLSARLSRWDVADIRPDIPGVQVYVDQGDATVDLIPPQVAGVDTLTARTSFAETRSRLAFSPDIEDRIVVGIIEGAVSLKGRGDLIENDEISLFEDTTTGLNGELYYKGRIRGDALLTLRYSSDRDTSDRLFRDIRRDEYYPVYGDNAEQGFDAQSSGNLFVKIEKDQSYVLYGDIAIEPEAPEFKLGAVSRLATGAKARWEDQNVRVSVFAARIAHDQRVSEFAGLGIAGPYELALEGFREGSDIVEILTRDRITGDILSAERLRRFDDYVLDYFSNTILFDDPVPQADADGNPVSVRVRVEVESLGGRHWLYGGEIGVTIDDQTEIGLRTVVDNAPAGTGERSRITAGFFRTAPSENSVLEIEVAEASSDAGVGGAVRLSFDERIGDGWLRFEASHTDRKFAPEGILYGPGRDRVRLEFGHVVSESLRADVLIDYTADEIAGTKELRAELNAERQIDEDTVSRVGIAYVKDFVSSTSANLLHVGTTWKPKQNQDLTFNLDLEAPFRGRAESTLEMGFERRVSERLAFSGVARAIASEDGHFDRFQHLSLGIDYTVNEWLEGRSEISADEHGAGRYIGRLAQGFDAHWQLADGLNLRASVEHTTFSEGETSTTSLATSADYLAPDGSWMADLDVDRSWRGDLQTTYVSAGTAVRANDRLTLLGLSRYARERRDGEADRTRMRTRLGAAYRSVDAPRADLLAWYERETDRGATSMIVDRWSLQGTWEANEDTRLNARYSGQRTDSGAGSRALIQLAQAGIAFDLLDDRWLLGLNISRIWDNAGFETTALGGEIGYAFAEDAIVTVGYSEGRKHGFDGGETTSGGLYFGVRLILSEELLDRFSTFVGGE